MRDIGDPACEDDFRLSDQGQQTELRSNTMPKDIPNCPGKPQETVELPKTYAVEVITPLVGGGVEAGRIDERFPIRATAIRGHLRHWWRLTIGRSLGAGMWRREEEIFGSTEFPS